jgi:hypothetical protein
LGKKITMDGAIDVYDMKGGGGSVTHSQFFLIGAWSKLYKRVTDPLIAKFQPLMMV